jgi:hypothetical protein
MCHLYGGTAAIWELPTNTNSNIRKPSEALFGTGLRLHWITFYQNSSPEFANNAVFQTVWMELKIVCCGRKVMNKTILLVVQVLAVFK